MAAVKTVASETGGLLGFALGIDGREVIQVTELDNEILPSLLDDSGITYDKTHVTLIKKATKADIATFNDNLRVAWEHGRRLSRIRREATVVGSDGPGVDTIANTGSTLIATVDASAYGSMIREAERFCSPGGVRSHLGGNTGSGSPSDYSLGGIGVSHKENSMILLNGGASNVMSLTGRGNKFHAYEEFAPVEHRNLQRHISEFYAGLGVDGATLSGTFRGKGPFNLAFSSVDGAVSVRVHLGKVDKTVVLPEFHEDSNWFNLIGESAKLVMSPLAYVDTVDSPGDIADSHFADLSTYTKLVAEAAAALEKGIAGEFARLAVADPAFGSALLAKVVRISEEPHFYLATGRGGGFYFVPDEVDFAVAEWSLASARPGNGGAAQANVILDFVNADGGIASIVIEVRYSHGRHHGYPEFKVKLADKGSRSALYVEIKD